MSKLQLKKEYKKYPEYKDSGIEWLGKIPRDWGVENLKKRTIFLNGYSFNSEDYTTEGLPIIRITDVGQEIDFSKVKRVPFKTRSKIQKFLVRKNDLLIALTGATIGKTSIYNKDEEMYLNQRVGIIRPLQSLDLTFLKFLIGSNIFRENVSLICSGGAQENIGTNQIGNIFFAIPEISKQKEIGAYLDEKTVIIDQTIGKKQKLIELLREKRTAEINNAVNTVGNNIEKLKYIAPERRTKATVAPNNSVYIGLENIESGTGKIVESKEKSELESSVNLFQKGDVLFGKLRPYLAKALAVSFEGVCSGEFLVLMPKNNKIIAKYLFYKLISRNFIKAIDDSTYGTKMPRANWRFIGNHIIKYPLLDEQAKIVQMLDLKLELFEKLINKANKSIKILNEFKSSLIFNVVTGKVRV
jgi:restriction endonuclease S subunit